MPLGARPARAGLNWHSRQQVIRFFFIVLLFTARAAIAAEGQLDASPALFTVMAAINAAGYDAELDSPNNHPLRDAIRAELAKRNIPSLAKIKEFYAAHRKPADLAEARQYVSFALSVSAPTFAFKGREIEIPPEAAALRDLAPLLAAFYKEAGIEDLWNRSQAAFDQYIERYHEPVAQAVLQVNSYLRSETSATHLGRRFQIYIDLLGAPNQVQTRSYGDEFFVVVTPSADLRLDDIRRAYLFYLLDPLATRSREVLERKKGIADHAQRAGALSGVYKEDFLLLTTASLVRAVEARLDRKPEKVQEALLEGFILTPYFAEQLPAYEKQEQSMRFYYPEMVKAINLRKEDARLASVEFLQEPPVRQARVAAPPPPPAITGAARTLEDAERLYLARELEKARELYMKVLQETAEKPLHAAAWYGLARIAALNRDPASAERLFLKTLESSPEPQVKAWTYVYLGRLAKAAGDAAQAGKYFESALAVEGASEAARRAAGEGAQQSKKP